MICSKCKVDLDLDKFRLGQKQCKLCKAAYQRAWRATHLDSVAKFQRSWAARNPETVKLHQARRKARRDAAKNNKHIGDSK